jgi:folate-binding protein YgfZ
MQATGMQNALDTPLAATHRNAGAKMGVWFGCAMPNEFTGWRGEYAFARNSVALIDKNYRAYLSFTGPDRVRYLNAILTNNIKDLQTGQGNVSLLLNPQGHILAEIETYALRDSLFCVSYAMIRARLVEVIEKYIIMDDVTLIDRTDGFATLALEGPSAAAVVRNVSNVDIATIEELSFCDGSVDEISCRIVKRSPGGVAGAEFVVERDKVGSLWQVLLAAVRKHGGGPMGYKALNALRLEMGVPWFGYDFGEKQIPHEAGLQESHISYTKGCYTGQEIVERVRSRGHANRVRVGLKFSSAELAAEAMPLFAGGQEIGLVTRTSYSPLIEARIGMGYVRRENSAPETVLECGDGKAEVISLPLLPASRD